ncbi:MAG: short-chain dehydrogenase [Deltaproteobacteria bacterium RBG_13_65_10]|nr:MAG: short-chain dehydrogenase [Deltaproteobacteria bacterium RBG_13_65_10]
MSSWDNLLEGRVALVTGGSRGLGRADALALADAGADVVIADIMVESDPTATRTEQESMLAQAMRAQGVVYTEKTVEDIRKMGRRAMAVKMDVTDRPAVFDGVARAVKEMGKIDVLVNNAGTVDHVARFEKQSVELWERDLRVNLTGSFNCAQAVWGGMKERQWGRIVNLASVAGTLGGYGQASYSTTKSGLIGLTKTLALEGARYNITCNAVVPGIIGSEAFKMADMLNKEMNDRMRKRTAFGREGEPEDIANAITFLCSDKAKYITGVALNVSGGIELFTF